jgi:hypothetical protein
MNTVLSEEFHTIVTEQPSIHLTQNQSQSQLEHTILQTTALPTLQIGENDANPTSQHSAQKSPLKSETNSVKVLPNLQSPAKPHEILEKQLEPKILKVSKQDIQAFYQMILEYQEQLRTF